MRHNPTRAAERQQDGDQLGQVASLPAPEQRRQPAARHQVRLVEHRRESRCAMRPRNERLALLM